MKMYRNTEISVPLMSPKYFHNTATVPGTDIPHGPHTLRKFMAEFFSELERHVSRVNTFAHLRVGIINCLLLVSVIIWTVSSPSSVMLNFSFLRKIAID